MVANLLSVAGINHVITVDLHVWRAKMESALADVVDENS